MKSESKQELIQMEADRKAAQQRLYALFLASPMTVADFEKRSRSIDMKFAREEAFIILEAIMNNE